MAKNAGTASTAEALLRCCMTGSVRGAALTVACWPNGPAGFANLLEGMPSEQRL